MNFRDKQLEYEFFCDRRRGGPADPDDVEHDDDEELRREMAIEAADLRRKERKETW